MMEIKPSMTQCATLVLLVMTCRNCSGLMVDPPKDLLISDPGHLGHLEIKWSPPAGLINTRECPLLYQLEYYNSYKNRWQAIRTSALSYSAQFNLMNDVQVRVHTLLNGPCTNGTMVKSTNTELVQRPARTGVLGTRVEDFTCVFYNMEIMECTWGQNAKIPADSQLHLYFWHKELGRTQECQEYITAGGVRRGCEFSESTFPRFTDITFCINGSSTDGPLEPLYHTLQVQDCVKPGTTTKPSAQMGPDKQLKVEWEAPAGNVPERCLEWEVEHKREGPNRKTDVQKILTTDTRLTLPLVHPNETHCFRIRSRLHNYCVDKSFWSKWSPATCLPDIEEVTPGPERDVVPVYVYIAIAISATLVLSLCVYVSAYVRRYKEEKMKLPI